MTDKAVKAQQTLSLAETTSLIDQISHVDSLGCQAKKAAYQKCAHFSSSEMVYSLKEELKEEIVEWKLDEWMVCALTFGCWR